MHFSQLTKCLLLGILVTSSTAFSPRSSSVVLKGKFLGPTRQELKRSGQYCRNAIIVGGLYDDLLNNMADRRSPPKGRVEVLVNGKPPNFPSASKPNAKSVKKGKLAKQRAGGAQAAGIVASGTPRDKQAIRVEMARRGQKQVTMVRGLEVDLEMRKQLLKKLKGVVGGGGTVDPVSGTVEIQGAHAERVVAFMIKEGFSGAKQAGKSK